MGTFSSGVSLMRRSPGHEKKIRNVEDRREKLKCKSDGGTQLGEIKIEELKVVETREQGIQYDTRKLENRSSSCLLEKVEIWLRK